MDNSYWQKQTNKALFPDVLWSLPENKHQAGTLLVMGGNVFQFSIVADAYQRALASGAGTVRAIMPDAVKKFTVGLEFDHEFGSSSHAGTFGKNTLVDIKAYIDTAHGLLIAGDLGRNSETTKALSDTVQYAEIPTIITRDAVDYFYHDILVLNKDNVVLVLSFSQLQRLLKDSKQPYSIHSNMGLIQLNAILYSLTTKYRFTIIVLHAESLVVASAGNVSTTKAPIWTDIWRDRVATEVAVICMQVPQNLYEAATTAVHIATTKKNG